MPQNFYEVVAVFIVYAFLGWCTEVAYAAVNSGKFVNRGFLNGPYCPIYGCGVLVVVAGLTPLQDNLVVLFVGSMVLTSAIEFVTGFVLEKAFHKKWWDYSEVPFNIKGYVCLKFSILWGIACTLVMKLMHPLIYKLITLSHNLVGIIILSVIMVAFAADLGITVATILKFNKRMKAMEEIAANLHKISDSIGEGIFEVVDTSMKRSEEFKETHKEEIEKAEARMEKQKEKLAEEKERRQKEREELQARYRELLETRTLGTRRLLKAFPQMKETRHTESFHRYREEFLQKLEEKKKHKEANNDQNN